MSRKEFHVVFNPKEGGWDVVRPHAKRASFHSETKASVVQRAREICRKERAELVIHGKDGKIQSCDSYGNDPHPPHGRKR